MRKLLLSLCLCGAGLTAAWSFDDPDWPDFSQPQNLALQQGDVARFTRQNLLRRNERISRYSPKDKVEGTASFAVDKNSGMNGEAFFLRHPLRVAPLSEYKIEGQIFVEKLEGKPTIVQVELLDQNREEYKALRFDLPAPIVTGKWIPFSFPFRTERKTPFARVWIVADGKAQAKFLLGGFKLEQTSAPRAVESKPLAVIDTSASSEQPLPEGGNYAVLQIATQGVPQKDSKASVEFLAADGKSLATYRLEWNVIPGVQSPDDQIAGTWYKSSDAMLGKLSFDRTLVPSADAATWPMELDIPPSAKTLRVTLPSGEGLAVKNFHAAIHREAKP